MEKSESIAKLTQALCAFQGEITNIVKDAVNPFYKSTYATLDSTWKHVRPVLSKHKLALAQFPSTNGTLVSMLMHESGEWISEPASLCIKDNTPQGQGSGIKYMRRYAMSSILGLVTEEDDDGNEATKPQSQETKMSASKIATTSTPTSPTAPCDNVACKNIAKTQYGKLCYTCNQEAKKGAVIFKRRSEGAVPEEEINVADIPF